MTGLRILQIGDLHCFPPAYSRPEGADGAPSRLREWQRCVDHVIRIARETKPDLIVCPGDYFVNARPSATQVLQVAQFIQDLDEVAPVIGCAGNHDLAAPGWPGPVAIIGSMTPRRAEAGASCWGAESVRIVDNPRFLRAAVAVLPSVKPTGLLEQSADPAALTQLVSAKLVEIARSLRARCNERHNILIGHWTIAGSVTSSGQVMVGGTEPALPLAELQAQGWDAVCFGHIHKPQVLSDKPFIGCAGALLRGDFGEEHDERGCYLIDLAAGTYEFIPVPARRFVTIDLDVADIAWMASGGAADAPLAGAPIDDAIVRVRYRTTAEIAKRIDHGNLIRALEAAGPHVIAGIYPEIERSDRARAEISETTGPDEALAKWLDLRADVSAGLREIVLAAARQVLREVA
jgi:DNA repair exonuclease SbcCD nuclease subunit